MGLVASARYSDHVGKVRLGKPGTEVLLKHSGSQIPHLSSGRGTLKGVWGTKQENTRKASAQSGPEEECVGITVPVSLGDQRVE